jgi:hypothetical protein
VYCDEVGNTVGDAVGDAVEVAVLPETAMFPAPAPGQIEDSIPLLHM